MVACSLSVDHLCQQKLLQCFAVSEYAGVFELWSKGWHSTALCYSNLWGCGGVGVGGRGREMQGYIVVTYVYMHVHVFVQGRVL